MTMEDFKQIPLHAKNNSEPTMLENVADVKMINTPTEVDHYQLFRIIDLYVSPKGEDLGTLLKRVHMSSKTPSCRLIRAWSLRGSVVSMRRSFESFAVGLSLSVVLVYLILMAQFASFSDPFLILLAVPPGFTGVILFLLMTHTTINIMSLMGVMMMIGIVVSDSILIVEFTRELRRRGQHCGSHQECLPRALAAHHDDHFRDPAGIDPSGPGPGSGQRTIRAAGARHHRRIDASFLRDGVPGALGVLPDASRKEEAGGQAERSAGLVFVLP